MAGAFEDGKQIVVEPLSNSLLYPNSRRDGIMMEPAQVLFALVWVVSGGKLIGTAPHVLAITVPSF